MGVLPDGRIVSGSEDRTVRIWVGESQDGEPAANPGIAGTRLCEDGRCVLRWYRDGTCKVLEPRTGEERLSIRLPAGEAAHSAAITRDGSAIVLQGVKGSLQLWNARTGVRVRRLRRAWRREPEHAVREITTDGRRVFVDHIRDLSSGRTVLPLGEFWVNGKRVTSDAALNVLSPDARRLAENVNEENGRWLDIVDVETRKRLQRFRPNMHWPAAFTPDARRVLFTNSEGHLEIRDLETGTPAAELQDSGFDIKVSPDNRRIFVGSSHGTHSIPLFDRPTDTICAWDGASFVKLWERGGTLPLSVSTDGRYLISGNSVPNAATGERVALTTFPYLMAMKDGLILGKDQAGGDVILELSGVATGPRVVTAEDAGERLLLFCPYCQTDTACSSAHLGEVVGCPNCARTLQLNPFVLRRKGRKEYALPVNSKTLAYAGAAFLVSLVGIPAWYATGMAKPWGAITVAAAMSLLLRGFMFLKQRA